VVRTVLIGMLCVVSARGANEQPDACEALKAFQGYVRYVDNRIVAQRYLSQIEKALKVSPISTSGEKGKHAPVLTFVVFSRTHFQTGHKPYPETRQKIDKLVASADFKARRYQLNDLHPDQARQSIWQFSRDGVSMRVVVVPNNAITVAFFSSDDFRSGLHAARRALIPPPQVR